MSNIFPKSANSLPLQLIVFLFGLGGIATIGVTYYMTPKYTRVGYAPVQPVPFSHSLHAGQLGLDCRYCHVAVDQGPASTVPAAQTCMNCHNQIKVDSPLLGVVRQSYETGDPVPWVKIHQVPDYVYFNHAVHVNRGVSCVECHGKVNEMEVVEHVQPLSMAFCLDCHRQPELRVREPGDVFNLDSPTITQRSGAEAGKRFVHDWNIKPPQSCSGCHR
jgi:hypothetical protein